MLISLIVAMAEDRAIGIENRLPWHLPADLRHFRDTTMGSPLIMGRLTHESIGRPLPGRRNIIVSRDPDYRAEGCEVVGSVEAALAAAAGAGEVFVMGGASLYAQLMPRCDRLYLTLVEGRFTADAYFPGIEPGEWREIAREDHAPDADNPHPYSFRVLERVGASDKRE